MSFYERLDEEYAKEGEKKYAHCYLRITRELHNVVSAAAKSKGVSMNQFGIAALRNAMDEVENLERLTP